MMPADDELDQRLLGLVYGATDADGRAWLRTARDALKSAHDRHADAVASLLLLSPLARRRLGRRPLISGNDVLETADGPIPLSAWELADAGRVLLLRAVGGGNADVVTSLYRAGDEAERISATRGLSLYGAGAELKTLALETGRANSIPLFASLALDNPYPAGRYGEREFNQLVLKALFVGLPLVRVVGLADRANAELARMCEDYIEERTAAGRSVPEDIALAMAARSGEQAR